MRKMVFVLAALLFVCIHSLQANRITPILTEWSDSTQIPKHEQAVSDAVAQIKNLLGTISDQVQIDDANFQFVKEDNKGVHVSGIASLFNINQVAVSAIVGTTLTEIGAGFPAGASHQVRIAGQNISDWMPDFARNKLDLTQLSMLFYPNEDNRTILSATLEQPHAAALLSINGFTINKPALTFSLERAGSDNASSKATAELKGNLVMGLVNFDLVAAANSRKEWSFGGILNNLQLSQFVRGVAAQMNLTLPPMPKPIEDFTIQQARLSLNSDLSARFKGITDIGTLETYLGKNKEFLLGIAPNANYKLSDISSALQPIDNLGLTDLAMIYATNTGRIDQELELISDMQMGSQTVKAGITLLGGFDIPDDLPGMTQKGKVMMRATLPPSITATPTLQAAVQFNGLQFGSDFRINESFLQLTPADLSFGAGLSLGARLDGNWINFSGMGDIAAPATFGLVVFMEPGSVWKNPFGIQSVEISNLGLDVGADIASPLPRPKLGISGALKIGPFQGAGAGMIDTGNPLNSLISVKVNQIGIQEFVNAFTSGQVRNELNKLPAMLRSFSLQDAELTIIPKTTEMAGRTYTQGLRVAGKTTLAGLGARLDLNAGFDSGFKGLGAVSPLIVREGGITLFQLSGNNTTDSARISVDLSYANMLSPKAPFFLIDGKVSLLGISSQTKVELNKNGVYLALQGNLFNKFQARLDAKGGSFSDVKGMAIRASMQNDLISYLNKEVTSAIDVATKESQAAYRKAKQELADAENYLRTTQKDVDAFNAHKRDVDKAKAEVEKLTTQVNKAKNDCDNAPWYRKADLCAVYGTLWTSRETAKGVLDGYNATLSVLRDAVDWSKREIAANTVKIAGFTVQGFEAATTGTLGATKWIVDKGLGGVVDLKSAEFSGQLDLLKGGNVNMGINVTFLGTPYNTGLNFNFNDPLSAAKALASTLLNNRAASGATATMASQIGTGYTK